MSKGNDFKQIQLLKNCTDQLMIGRLRKDAALLVTSTGLIRYFVDPYCDDFIPVMEHAEIISKQDVSYGGVDSREDWDGLNLDYDHTSEDLESKKSLIREYLEDKWIVFLPEFNRDGQNQIHKNFYIYSILPDRPNVQATYFTAVPIVNMPSGRFEKILRDGQYFDLPEYRASVRPSPEIIFCQDCAYVIRSEVNEDIFLPQKQFDTSWKCVNPSLLQKVEYKKIPEHSKYIFEVNESLCFIEDYFRNQLETYEEEVVVEKKEEEIVPIVEEVVVSNDASRELSFLHALQQLTSENGLCYEFNDLINFHTSVKTNPLTILAGMSGTGKTQLAYNYASMLNLGEDSEELLFMPISPSYTEPSDVLGYLNAMNHEYVPSESGLVPFLIHAQKYPNRMHMVIFDEMNLSQVEYWFSPFISILEKEENDRFLTLYESHANCTNRELFPSQVKIGRNIIFVGTVNLDETTKEFSDRLLDRTFMISLHKGNFKSFFKAFENLENQVDGQDIESHKCKSAQEFLSWSHTGKVYLDIFKGHEKELDFLDELDSLIQKYIPDGGISYRVLKNIGNYLKNVPLLENGDMIMDRKDVFDVIVKETILTKIRGTETQLHNLIGEPNGDYSELLILLDQFKEVSDFKLVRNNVLKKAEELRIHGYAH
ncbi:MAG: AAA family ATPase [Bacillota bacterium]|nr:AAA family ATPase [Bacillota bacterium]